MCQQKMKFLGHSSWQHTRCTHDDEFWGILLRTIYRIYMHFVFLLHHHHHYCCWYQLPIPWVMKNCKTGVLRQYFLKAHLATDLCVICTFLVQNVNVLLLLLISKVCLLMCIPNFILNLLRVMLLNYSELVEHSHRTEGLIKCQLSIVVILSLFLRSSSLETTLAS